MLPKSGRWNQLPAASDDEQVVGCSTDRTWRQYILTWCTGAPRRLKPGVPDTHFFTSQRNQRPDPDGRPLRLAPRHARRRPPIQPLLAGVETQRRPGRDRGLLETEGASLTRLDAYPNKKPRRVTGVCSALSGDRTGRSFRPFSIHRRRGHALRAPCKGVVLRWVQMPPGTWVAPAGSYRSGGGGNETVGAFETDGSLGDSASRQAVTRVNVEQASRHERREVLFACSNRRRA